MAKPKLAEREEDVWKGGFVTNPPQVLRDVSGAGGHVVAGGDVLLGLRPGRENWGQRPQLDDLLGPLVAVAAEQGPPWRFGVASPGGITLLGLPNDQKMTLRPSTPVVVTHLAWGNLGEERVLYVRWDDGVVGRVRLDLQTIEELHVLPMDAIASDANGSLAMVSARTSARDAHALWTPDGIRFEERDLTATFEDVDPEARVHLAVADAAVACAAEGKGTYLSRGIDEDLVPCEGLPQGGPLAFQGSSADAALFGVSWNKLVCAIDRVSATGAVQRIVEMGSDVVDAPRIAALQWDQSRRTLWSASPMLGLMKSEEPRGKGGKRPSVN